MLDVAAETFRGPDRSASMSRNTTSQELKNHVKHLNAHDITILHYSFLSAPEFASGATAEFVQNKKNLPIVHPPLESERKPVILHSKITRFMR
jgi:hypothetical protein